MPLKYQTKTPAPPEEPGLYDRFMNILGMGEEAPAKSTPKPSEVKAPEPQTGQGYVPDVLQHGAATVARVAGPWIGSVLGGAGGATTGGALGLAGGPAAVPAAVGGGLAGAVAGGAAGGAAGEYLAQMMEPGGLARGTNMKRVGVSTALGAVPGAAVVRAGKPLASAALGAAQGYAGTAGYKMADGTTPAEALNPAEWSGAELLFGPGLGAGVGAGLGKLTGGKAGPSAPLPPKPPAPAPRVNEYGVRVFTGPPQASRQVPLGAEEIESVRQAATQSASPTAGRIAKQAVNKTKQSLKDASVDTRPSTTAPVPDGFPSQLASPEDIAANRTALPETPSEATQAALKRAANKRMGPAQLSKERSSANSALKAEAGADLAHQKAISKAAEEAANEADAQSKIDAFLSQENVEGSGPTLTTTATKKVPGGKDTLKETFRVKPPEEEGDGIGDIIGGGPAKTVTPTGGAPTGSLDPDIVKMTSYKTREQAMDVARRVGRPFDIDRVGHRGNYSIRFLDGGTPKPSAPLAPLGPPGPAASKFNSKVDEILAKAEPTAQPDLPTPPPEAPATPPPTPDVPPPTAPEPPAPPSLDQMSVQGRRMSKRDAQALAKQLGMEVHQVGPRIWTVRAIKGDAPAMSEAPIPFEPPTPTEPPAPFKPATPYVPDEAPVAPIKMGDLSPEEFRRYMDIQPGFGTRRTPAEMAEFRELHSRINGKPKVEAPPPVEAPAPKVEEPPMSVEEFAGALSKEGSKPIAEVPFSLDRQAAKPTSKQAALADAPDPAFEAMLDRAAGEPGGVPKPMNPKGQGTMITQPGLGEMTTPPGGSTTSEPGALAKMAGMSDEEFRKAVSKPKSSQAGAIPARLFKSRLEAAGEGYGAIKEAKRAGEKVPEAGRAIAGKNAAMENAKAVSKLPKAEAPAPAKPKVAADMAELTSNDLSKMDPEAQTKALTDIVNRFKGEKGQISVETLARLGLGSAGALAGAAANPDDPLTGALLGAGAGAFAPSVARALINRASQTNNPKTVTKVGERVKDYVETFFRMMPDYQRFSLLAHPRNLPMNAAVGPWGAAIMASIEHAISGDTRGLAGLKSLLNPKNFPKEWYNARNEAWARIANANERTEGTMGQAGPEIYRTVTAFPGVMMTAGDIASRNLLVRAGFTPEEARRITLTSEPYSALGRGISALKKAARTAGSKRSWLMDMAVPFYKTATNQLEQSAERAPFFLGMIYQKYAKDVPDSQRIQLAQQVLSSGVTYGAYQLGTIVPEEDSRGVLKFISNFGGQYGMVASTAFMMGQATKNGTSKTGAVQRAAIEGIPLPTGDVVNNAINNAGALLGDESKTFKEPFKLVPGILDPKINQSLPDLLGFGPEDAPVVKRRPVRPTRPASNLRRNRRPVRSNVPPNR